MRNLINTQSIDLGNPQKLVIGLVADTHTTRRRPNLHPGLLPALRAVRPDLIFHAGDISIPQTLDDLQEIAPVTAVQGNRDITSSRQLPEAYQISLAGKSIYLTHGHAPFFHYLVDKTYYLRLGYRFPRYYEYFQQIAAETDLIIFGHTHIPVHQQVGSQCFINPGAACLVDRHDPFPCFAVLTLGRDMDYQVKFHFI